MAPVPQTAFPKPSVSRVDRNRVAANVLVALVTRYGPSNVTPNEARSLARTAYVYADAMVAESEVPK